MHLIWHEADGDIAGRGAWDDREARGAKAVVRVGRVHLHAQRHIISLTLPQKHIAALPLKAAGKSAANMQALFERVGRGLLGLA